MKLSPRGKARLRGAFLAVPLPISRWLFALARRTVFPNGNAPQFERAFKAVADAGLVGDYLEFGVFQGNSFVLAAHMVRKYSLDMRLYAFDSCEGLPEGEGDRFQRGDYRCSQEQFVRMIGKAGVAIESVTCVPGWFEQTLTSETKERLGLCRAAVVHIDCDLYSSTSSVLAFLDGLLAPGAVIIFDDWHAFANEEDPEGHGEQKAFRSWELSDRFAVLYDVPPTRAFVMVGRDARPLQDGQRVGPLVRAASPVNGEPTRAVPTRARAVQGWRAGVHE